MTIFFLSLWLLSFCVVSFFQNTPARLTIDSVALTLSGLCIGYILTIFYQMIRYRTSIRWLKIQTDEAEHENL